MDEVIQKNISWKSIENQLFDLGSIGGNFHSVESVSEVTQTWSS